MHWIIYAELKKYVDTRLGRAAWPTLLSESGLSSQSFLPYREHPDAHALALVTTASRVTGLAAGAILEDFGDFIAEDLLKLFWNYVQPHWRTLDLIEKTEATIHAVVRTRHRDARPPELTCRRISATEVVIDYRSARKMCAVAKGIARGVAKHYGDEVRVTESQCMLTGAPSCLISVVLVPATLPAPASESPPAESPPVG